MYTFYNCYKNLIQIYNILTGIYLENLDFLTNNDNCMLPVLVLKNCLFCDLTAILFLIFFPLFRITN